ncbi:MAG: hypothetical protein JXK94_01550 [Deltaproteobacteria bacterium]|nr:hypothetical protein [Deltaproteobacteria bacterium]
MEQGLKNEHTSFVLGSIRSGIIIFLLAASACSPGPRLQPKLKPVLDQSFDAAQVAKGTTWENVGAGIGLGIGFEAAQTFKVGISGILTSVDIQIFHGTNAQKNILFIISKTRDGKPSENAKDILARTVIDLKNVNYATPANYKVDLIKHCIAVHNGDVLAIILGNKDEISGCGWQTADGDHYNRGKRFSRSFQAPEWTIAAGRKSGHDLGFNTYVAPHFSCRPK